MGRHLGGDEAVASSLTTAYRRWLDCGGQGYRLGIGAWRTPLVWPGGGRKG